MKPDGIFLPDGNYLTPTSSYLQICPVISQCTICTKKQ